jgi:hypothetical membrane protein
MTLRSSLWLKVFGSCGIAAPIVALTCIFFAIVSHPQFSWTDNALSDLGVVEGATSTLFNSGLVTGGILTAMFGLGLSMLLKQKTVGKLGSIFFILDAASLTAIGIFPENARPMHFYASVTFFALFPIATFLVAASFFLMEKARRGTFTLLAATFATAVWVAQFSIHYVPQVAIPETLSSLSASIWSMFLGFKMFKESAAQHHNTEPDQ